MSFIAAKSLVGKPAFHIGGPEFKPRLHLAYKILVNVYPGRQEEWPKHWVPATNVEGLV